MTDEQTREREAAWSEYTSATWQVSEVRVKMDRAIERLERAMDRFNAAFPELAMLADAVNEPVEPGEGE